MHATRVVTTLRPKGVLKQVTMELAKEGKFSVETIWITKNGKAIYGEVKIDAIYDRDGTFVGGRGVLRDTTDRKLAEQALRERETELEIKKIVVALMKIASAHKRSWSFMGFMFWSTIRISHDGGKRAATVANPRGR